MTSIIIIFFIAILGAFGMLLFQAWEIRTSRIQKEEDGTTHLPELSFRRIEKIFLVLTKYIVQSIVLFSVKNWYLFITKTKVLFMSKMPKINKFFEKKSNGNDSRKISFVERAVMESKIKIKRVKEKIKKDHAEEIKEIEEEIKTQEDEVDKIL